MITNCDAYVFLDSLEDQSVHLLCIDPPYYGIVAEEWDNAWPTVHAYSNWLNMLLQGAARKMTADGSLICFGAIGSRACRPLFELMIDLDRDTSAWHYRNLITWKKRRAYGKSHDYLFCREEIIWYSRSTVRTEVRFNIPLTNVKRGYAGFDKDHPAKSEYKRVSNVFVDEEFDTIIEDYPELMRPSRTCEKPVPLMKRLVETHSHPGDLVVDCFAGTGTTSVAALQTGRRFLGCDTDPAVCVTANERIKNAVLL